MQDMEQDSKVWIQNNTKERDRDLHKKGVITVAHYNAVPNGYPPENTA